MGYHYMLERVHVESYIPCVGYCNCAGSKGYVWYRVEKNFKTFLAPLGNFLIIHENPRTGTLSNNNL